VSRQLSILHRRSGGPTEGHRWFDRGRLGQQGPAGGYSPEWNGHPNPSSISPEILESANLEVPCHGYTGIFKPGIKENLILSFGSWWDAPGNRAELEKMQAKIEWPILVAAGGTIGAGPPSSPIDELSNVFQLKTAASWLSRAKVFLLPSETRDHNFLSEVEPALAGCALLLPDKAVYLKRWEGAAVFIKPGCWQSMCLALRDLIEHPRIIHELSKRSRHRARNIFTQEIARMGYENAPAQSTLKEGFGLKSRERVSEWSA
jgi:glycosyltransferase involved in cell wall biosynthesis